MLAHVLPMVPPDVDGVGNYCHQLWKHWPQPKPSWQLVTSHVPNAAGFEEVWPGAAYSSFERNSESLNAALQARGASRVVLHYSPYAYQKRGCPLWLAPALKNWKRESGGRLIVMFHELYWKGSPRQSSYWLSPLARRAMSDVARTADAWVTNCAEYFEQIPRESRTDAQLGTMLPIGPTIEPAKPTDFGRPWPLAHGGKLKIVIFGTSISRFWSLRAHQGLLRLLCESEKVESILVLGKSDTGQTSRDIQQLTDQIGHTHLWRYIHDLPADEVSARIGACDLALVPNWPGTLTKSTVFASMCAHGIPSIGMPAPKVPHTLPASPVLREQSVPHLTNNDARPQECGHLLEDAVLMATLRSRLQTYTTETLNWGAIARKWSDIVSG